MCPGSIRAGCLVLISVFLSVPCTQISAVLRHFLAKLERSGSKGQIEALHCLGFGRAQSPRHPSHQCDAQVGVGRRWRGLLLHSAAAKCWSCAHSRHKEHVLGL